MAHTHLAEHTHTHTHTGWLSDLVLRQRGELTQHSYKPSTPSSLCTSALPIYTAGAPHGSLRPRCWLVKAPLLDAWWGTSSRLKILDTTWIIIQAVYCIAVAGQDAEGRLADGSSPYSILHKCTHKHVCRTDYFGQKYFGGKFDFWLSFMVKKIRFKSMNCWALLFHWSATLFILQYHSQSTLSNYMGEKTEA